MIIEMLDYNKIYQNNKTNLIKNIKIMFSYNKIRTPRFLYCLRNYRVKNQILVIQLLIFTVIIALLTIALLVNRVIIESVIEKVSF